MLAAARKNGSLTAVKGAVIADVLKELQMHYEFIGHLN